MDEARLLIVDDSVDAAEMLVDLLMHYGYCVRVAHDGAEARGVIEKYKPHGVLLDINMPGLDGAELSKRLRERFADDIVLIAITGTPADDQRVSETFAGKTSALAAEEARALLGAIDVSTLPGLRDRALIGLMVYTFARVGAAVGMRVGDVYVQGRRTWVRLRDKGGKTSPQNMSSIDVLNRSGEL